MEGRDAQRKINGEVIDLAPPLKSVHEVLGESRFEAKPETKENCTFRLEPSVQEIAAEICARNGTTLSAYLRGCCRQLIEDYRR